jgi:hypothetical protein
LSVDQNYSAMLLEIVANMWISLLHAISYYTERLSINYWNNDAWPHDLVVFFANILTTAIKYFVKNIF